MDTMETNYALIQGGIVINVIIWDGNSDPETGGITTDPAIAYVLLGPDDHAYIGLGATQNADGTWTFDVPPPLVLTPAQILANNTATRNSLLAAANLVIPALQDAVDLEDPSANPSLLLAWKQFRVAVNKVNLTLLSPPWPIAPQAGYGAAIAPSVGSS